MILADELGMSLARCQKEISSREFLLWRAYRQWKLSNEFKKEHHYLAQIAAEVRRSNPKVKNPRSIKDKDFLLKFEPKKSGKVVPKDPKLQLSMSKGFWFGLAGLGSNNKPVKRKAVRNGRDRKISSTPALGEQAIRKGNRKGRASS